MALAVAILGSPIGLSTGERPVAADAAPQMRLTALEPAKNVGPDAADLDFRSQYGFDLSLDTIHQLKNSPLAMTPALAARLAAEHSASGAAWTLGSVPWPIALSTAEHRELDYRALVVQPAMTTDAINTYLAAHRDTYAGRYIDNQNGGKAVFLFTADVATRKQELREIFAADPDRLDVRQVAYTAAYLGTLKDKFTGDLGYLSTLGLDSVAVDTVHNAVLVSGPGGNGTTLAVVARRYGDAPVELQPTPAFPEAQGSYGKSSLPFMASQNLQYNTPFNGMVQCSSGFQIKDSSGNYFSTTAGHCGWLGGGFAQNSLVAPNGGPGWWIGGVANDTWNWLYTCTVTGSGPSNINGTQTFPNDCANADALAIGEWSGAASNKLPVSATFTGQYNQTMTYSNILRVTAEEGWNGDVAGGTYCRSSINDNGYTCGTELWHNVAERYYNPADNGLTVTFPYMRVMNFAGHGGDSGAPYFQLGGPNGGVIAVGLQAGAVAGNGTDAFFSQIFDVESGLGAVHVVTNTMG